MCLAIALFRVAPDLPLVVAANRDELYARPATPLGRLADGPPRVVGGRDLQAGGTWLATNEHGVVAALTNQPGARVPGRRSRGELPLLATAHATADEAVRALTALDPTTFSGAWLFVGDRDALHVVDMTGPRVVATALPPGVHVLENVPFGAASTKVARVRAHLAGIEAQRGDALVAALARALADHTRDPIEPPTRAACVHTATYGTRSAQVISVGSGYPRIHVADGPPCTTPLAPTPAAF